MLPFIYVVLLIDVSIIGAHYVWAPVDICFSLLEWSPDINVQTPYGKSKTPPFGRNINAVFPTGER